MYNDLNDETFKRTWSEKTNQVTNFIKEEYNTFKNYFNSYQEIVKFIKVVNIKMSIDALKVIKDNIERLISIKSLGFTEANISSILNSSGSKLTENITALLEFSKPIVGNDKIPLYDANNVPYTLLSYLTEQGFKPNNISSMLNASGAKLAVNITALFEFLRPALDSDGNILRDTSGTPYTRLSYLLAQGFEASNISSILHGSSASLAVNIKALVVFTKPILDSNGDLLCDTSETPYTLLSYLVAQGFKPSNISSILSDSSANLAENIAALLEFTKPALGSDGSLLCDSNGEPYTWLSYLLAQGFEASNISSILCGSGTKLAENIATFLEFTKPALGSNGNLLCDTSEAPYTLLSYLVAQGFKPSNISSMLCSSRAKLAVNIAALLDFTKPALGSDGNLLCDTSGAPYTLLSYLVAQGFEASNISSMLCGSRANLAANILALLDFSKSVLDYGGNLLCDTNGVPYTLLSYLVSQGFEASNISSILHRSRAKLAVNIAALLEFSKPVLGSDGNLLCDTSGVPHTHLSYLMAQGFEASNISSMLCGSSANLTGNIAALLEFSKPALGSDGSLLRDTSGAPYTLLSYLVAQGFGASNISSMLSGSRANLAVNILALLDFSKPVLHYGGNLLCDTNGVPYTLLSYLVSQGFEASNISSILHGSRAKLAANIAALLGFSKPVLGSDGNLLCDTNGAPYTLLSYLLTQGFEASNISSMLCGSSANLTENIAALLEFSKPVLDSNGSLLGDTSNGNGQALISLQNKPYTFLEYIKRKNISINQIMREINGIKKVSFPNKIRQVIKRYTNYKDEPAAIIVKPRESIVPNNANPVFFNNPPPSPYRVNLNPDNNYTRYHSQKTLTGNKRPLDTPLEQPTAKIPCNNDLRMSADANNEIDEFLNDLQMSDLEQVSFHDIDRGIGETEFTFGNSTFFQPTISNDKCEAKTDYNDTQLPNTDNTCSSDEADFYVFTNW